MSDLLKLLFAIIIFFFILQIISKVCFKSNLIEGLCSAPDGQDQTSAYPDQTTCEAAGSCSDGSSLEPDCTTAGETWTPYTWTEDETPGQCYNQNTNEIVPDIGSASLCTGSCNNVDGLPVNNETECSEKLSDEGTCNGDPITGGQTACSAMDPPGTWVGPSITAQWTPYEWRTGSGESTTGELTPTGTCSDNQYTTEETCEQNGVCNNADDSTPTSSEQCTGLWATLGSCQAGGFNNDNVPPTPSEDATTSEECSAADCADGAGGTTGCIWTDPEEGPSAEWTQNVWTPDRDCEGTWSPCTGECETADQRTWVGTQAQSGNGAPCPPAVDCTPGMGGCLAENQELLVDSSDLPERTQGNLQNMNFNVIIQPVQPSQPCQPGFGDCPYTMTGPNNPCSTNDDCTDDNTVCQNNMCVLSNQVSR